MTTIQASEELCRLDAEIDAAITSQDGAALERICADDFMYTHSDGKMTQTRSEYIRLHVTAKRSDTPPSRVLTDQQAEVHGDIAVTRGDMTATYSDGRPTLYRRYVRVYRMDGGRWRAISSRTLYALDRAPAK